MRLRRGKRAAACSPRRAPTLLLREAQNYNHIYVHTLATVWAVNLLEHFSVACRVLCWPIAAHGPTSRKSASTQTQA